MRFFTLLPAVFCLGVQALPTAEKQDGPKVVLPHSTVKIVPVADRKDPILPRDEDPKPILPHSTSEKVAVADPKEPILPRDEDPKPILPHSSAVEKASPADPIKTILPRDGVPKPILPQSKVEAADPKTSILPRLDVPTILSVSRVEKALAADPTKPILPTQTAQLAKREHITVTIEKELDKLDLTLDSTVKHLLKKLGLKAVNDDIDMLLSGLVGNVDGVLSKVDKIVGDLLTDLGLDGLNETICDVEKALGLGHKNTIRKLLRSLHLL